MSSLTDEWHLKKENSIKYWIDICAYIKKMSWRSGKEIFSKNFKISESVFSLSIYPNGVTADEKGHVSVHLKNKNDHRAKVSARFSMKSSFMKDDDAEMSKVLEYLPPAYIHANDLWDVPLLVSHGTLLNEALLHENQRFTLQVEVDLFEEEVLASRPVEEEGNAVAALQMEVWDLKGTMNSIDNEAAKIPDLLKKMEEIERNMEKILLIQRDVEKILKIINPSPALSVQVMKDAGTQK